MEAEEGDKVAQLDRKIGDEKENEEENETKNYFPESTEEVQDTHMEEDLSDENTEIENNGNAVESTFASDSSINEKVQDMDDKFPEKSEFEMNSEEESSDIMEKNKQEDNDYRNENKLVNTVSTDDKLNSTNIINMTESNPLSSYSLAETSMDTENLSFKLHDIGDEHLHADKENLHLQDSDKLSEKTSPDSQAMLADEDCQNVGPKSPMDYSTSRVEAPASLKSHSVSTSVDSNSMNSFPNSPERYRNPPCEGFQSPENVNEAAESSAAIDSHKSPVDSVDCHKSLQNRLDTKVSSVTESDYLNSLNELSEIPKSSDFTEKINPDRSSHNDNAIQSNPQSPSETSDTEGENQRSSEVKHEEDSDSLDLTADSSQTSAYKTLQSPEHSNVGPEDIDSPESDMGQKENMLSNTEDIDSSESDLDDEGEIKSQEKVKVIESAASPLSESGEDSEQEFRKEDRNIRNDMYNDVSDAEESFSEDENDVKHKMDSYKVDSAVKEAMISGEHELRWKKLESKQTVSKDSMSFPSHTGLGEDQDELDYDEDVTEEDHGKSHDDSKEKMDDSRAAETTGKEKKEDGEADSDKDDGELDDDEDCEEGEIKEPGSRRPFIKPLCRFFTRGVCTWGNSCRFLHPGVNDKGNYRLIERPGLNSLPYGRGSGPWKGSDEQSPPPEEEESQALPPPPPPPPQPETAWERGLRQAKEQLKKANQRKEMEPDFEQKRLNLSIEEKEFNKENDRQKMTYKDPYYEPGYEDEYYDKPLQRSPSPIGWQQGQYENFEVRWTREAEWPPQPQHMPHYRERIPPVDKFHQQRFSPPPMQSFESPQRRHHHHHPHRENRRNNNKHWEGDRMPNQSYQEPPTRHKADSWHDPWRRSKSPKRKLRSSRSRSRGRRRSRRSHSYSSSFSSSSFSGSSRSRSSSYSSYSSRSSSRSSSSSRSPSHSPVKRPPGPAVKKIAEPGKPGEKPKSAVAKGEKQKYPLRKQNSRPQGSTAPPQSEGPPVPKSKGPGTAPQPTGPLDPTKVKPREKPNIPQRPGKRVGSSSSGRSRSRSSSSASSRSSSASSLSSISSHTSSSSSGSADSEHLYRGVGDAPISPKKKKGLKTIKPIDKRPAMRGKPAGPGNKIPRENRQEARVTTAAQPTVKPKDPLKITGQKPNIKLTLLANKPPTDKGGPGTKKRPAGDQDTAVAPAAKRPNVTTTQPPKPDKKLKRPDKPMVTKITSVPTKMPVAQSAVPPVKPSTKPAAPGGAGAVPVQKEKKSTTSRREELLKQLKAVEDAIARKRSKLN